MAIKLISDKVQTKEIQGAKIHFKEIPGSIYQKLMVETQVPISDEEYDKRIDTLKKSIKAKNKGLGKEEIQKRAEGLVGRYDLDQNALQEKLVEYSVMGWDEGDVLDSEGEPAEFSIDNLKLLGFSAYIEVCSVVTDIFTTSIDKEAEEIKNSQSTSSLQESGEILMKTTQSTSMTDAASNAEPGVQSISESPPAIKKKKRGARKSESVK